MVYSEYRLEDIMEYYNNYQEVCDIFFNLASDLETKEKLKKILYDGGYSNYSVSSKIVGKDNAGVEGNRRISMAYLLLKDPKTFNSFVENNVNIFHGTNSNALPGIIKYGLNSHKKSEDDNINISTGEKWSRIYGARDYISFTDNLDIAQSYSMMNQKDKDLLSFEVVIGFSTDDILSQRICRVSSDLPEVGVKDNMPVENIKTICVPEDKVEFVKKMINNANIQVLPLSHIDEKFYYINNELAGGNIQISSEDINKLKVELSQRKSNKVFANDEIRNMTLGRFLTKIKEQLTNLSLLLKKNKGVEYDGRKVK